MSAIRMVESMGDHEITYLISKNGAHSGEVSVLLDQDMIVDKMNFTTAHELSSALNRAQIAAISRASTETVIKSTADSPAAEHFVKNSIDYLRQLTGFPR